MPKLRATFFFAAALTVCSVAQFAFAQAPPTNRALLDSCIRRTIRAAVEQWGSGRPEIVVDSSRDAALLIAPLYRAAAAIAGDGNGKRCKARVTNAETKYKTIGDDRVARTVAVSVLVSVTSQQAGVIGWANELGASIADTVRCDDIPLIERGEGIPAAHAPDPCTEEATAFSSIVEPVLLALASATVIILLFTIRSH